MCNNSLETNEGNASRAAVSLFEQVQQKIILLRDKQVIYRDLCHRKETQTGTPQLA